MDNFSLLWHDLAKHVFAKMQEDQKLNHLPFYDWRNLSEQDQEIAAIEALEFDIYNSGNFMQFFTNWGYKIYQYALRGLQKIGAIKAAQIIENCYQIIAKLEDDSRIIELEDIPKLLDESEIDKLLELSQEYLNYSESQDILKLAYNYYKNL